MADYDAQAGREPRAPAEPSQRRRESDESDYHEGLRGVAGIVAGAGSVTELLSAVAQFAARAIPGVEGAGVALINPNVGLPTRERSAATACARQPRGDRSGDRHHSQPFGRQW